MANNTFLSKFAGPIAAIAIAIMGVAASWGSAKSEVATQSAAVQEIKENNKAVDDRVRELEIKDGANTEILKNILEKLDNIQKDIKDIKSTKHGG